MAGSDQTKVQQGQPPVDAESFRLLVSAVQDYAIFMLDPTGHVMTWNLGAERVKGYKAHEIIGQHFSKFYPPEVAASGKLEWELETAKTTGRFQEEGWRVRKDGSRFWASVTITALRNPAGELVGFGKVTRDLTERMLAEEAIRHSEERLRLLLDSVRDYAIFMLDPTGHVASWNPGAERLKGYKGHEIIGKHFSIFYPPEVAATGKAERELEIARTEGRFEEEGWRVRKDGSQFWASVFLTAVRDERGDLRGFAKVTRDLTERKQAEDERLRLARADEAIRLRDEFLSLASHELRTPLTPLSMHLQTLEKQVSRGDRVDTNAVGKARKQVRRLARLIDDLLDFSRVQEGRLELDRAPVGLGEIVESVVDDFRGTERTHTFEIEKPAPALMVNADRNRLEQVIVNLLQNAVKYSPEGGAIKVHLSTHDGDAIVAVTDQGIGIPIEDQVHLFERFFRAHNAQQRHFAGLGLGLFLSNEIVTRHGGHFSVESMPGKGSTFRFTVPLIGTATAGVSPTKVLVVDDDDSILDAMQSFLASEGYQVETAINGQVALELLRHHHYSLILIDLMMPVLDGAALVEQLRKERLATDTPITVFSADGNVREKGARLRVDSVLRKPLDLDDLAATVKRLAKPPEPAVS